MSSFEIRPATLADAKAVAQLHAQVLQTIYDGIVPAEQLAAQPMDKRVKYWREAIEFGEPQVQVADWDGQIVGLVGYDRSRDPKTKPTVGEVWAIYVPEAHWDKGIGLALWDAAREGLEDEGCTTVTVWVPLRLERALRFMELAGFKRELNTARTTPMGGVKIEEIRLKRALA